MLGLTVSDIVFAASISFVLTWAIKIFTSLWKVLRSGESIEIKRGEKELAGILQKCYSLFPKEIVQFRGKTFKRGMKVRIVTNQHKTIEGKLIGMNNEDILCIITQKYIIAHEISNIEDMTNDEEIKI